MILHRLNFRSGRARAQPQPAPARTLNARRACLVRTYKNLITRCKPRARQASSMMRGTLTKLPSTSAPTLSRFSVGHRGRTAQSTDCDQHSRQTWAFPPPDLCVCGNHDKHDRPDVDVSRIGCSNDATCIGLFRRHGRSYAYNGAMVVATSTQPGCRQREQEGYPPTATDGRPETRKRAGSRYWRRRARPSQRV